MQDKSTLKAASCRFLFTTEPLVINPDLACAVGLGESMVLMQVHYWIKRLVEKKDKSHFHDGRYWTYNSVEAWNRQFPFWSERTLRRAIEALLRDVPSKGAETPARGPLLLRKQLHGTLRNNPWDRTYWYTVAYENLFELERQVPANPCGQNDHMHKAKLAISLSKTSPENEDGGVLHGLTPVAAAVPVGTQKPIRCRSEEFGSVDLKLDLTSALRTYLGKDPSASMQTSLRCAVQRIWKTTGQQVTQEHLELAAADAWHYMKRMYGTHKRARGFFPFEEGLRKAVKGEISWAKR